MPLPPTPLLIIVHLLQLFHAHEFLREELDVTKDEQEIGTYFNEIFQHTICASYIPFRLE